jgi:hypothetical protein
MGQKRESQTEAFYLLDYFPDVISRDLGLKIDVRVFDKKINVKMKIAGKIIISF